MPRTLDDTDCASSTVERVDGIVTLSLAKKTAIVDRPGMAFPRMTVGVMGSAGGDLTDGVRDRVHRLGETIGRRGYVLITGACPGLPHEAVAGAKEQGGFVVGISPAHNLVEHVTRYNSPTRGYDAIIYTGSGLMGREVENIRTCDIVVFAGGRSGTLGEFASAFEEGKVIGVLESTGGIADHLDKIIYLLKKKTSAVVCYNPDPDGLMDQLEQAYKKHMLPGQLKALASRSPDGTLDP